MRSEILLESGVDRSLRTLGHRTLRTRLGISDIDLRGLTRFGLCSIVLFDDETNIR